jgi:small subunit ribosomal protein S4e
MVKDHIKRINAPKRWDILRKDHTFITRPNAGRDFSLCIALNPILKELLNKTQTTKESKYLIKNKGVLVNGKPVYDEKYPVGFFDVVSFPTTGENYRLLVNEKNKLFLLKIKDDEAKLKLSKVWDKKNLPKGAVQINCSDGRNFVMKSNEPLLKEISINDSILYTIPDHKIKQVIKLEKGTIVYLYKGKHIGNIVTVDDFKKENIIFKLDNETFETKKVYAFAAGKEKPLISLNEKKSFSEKPSKETKIEVKTDKA